MKDKMQDLSGKTITATDGKRYTLGKMAGYGNQGVVYENDTGEKMIKLYYPSGSRVIDKDNFDRLRFIKNVKMPKNFVEITDLIDNPYVGYVMDKVIGHKALNDYLIPDGNQTFAEWYNKDFGLRGRIFIGYIIAKAFSRLEENNISYCDISGNNILVKVGKKASIRMIDVDNIYVAGRGAASVLGTPRYIAPEVISRQRTPDVLSDNYSLAVLIFEVLRVGHPYISDDILDGTPEDEEAALAGRCEYVDEDNSTNMLPADVVFTEKLKRLFERCFVEGKNNRIARPSAREFEYALLEASNKLIKCPSCGAWHYPRKKNGVYECCPWCDSVSKPKARLNFYELTVKGENYRTGQAIDGSEIGKLVNTYILREGKNRIKNLYVLRSDDPSKAKRSEEEIMTVPFSNDKYWAYNEHSRRGIIVRKYKTGNHIEIPPHKAISLESGDRIYFEDTSKVEIEIGGKAYSHITMAIFMEETE